MKILNKNVIKNNFIQIMRSIKKGTPLIIFSCII